MKGQNGILHMTFSFSNTSTNLKLSPISLANTLTPYYLSNFISHSPFMNLHTPVLIDYWSIYPIPRAFQFWGPCRSHSSRLELLLFLFLWWTQPPGTASKYLLPVAVLWHCGHNMVLSLEKPAWMVKKQDWQELRDRLRDLPILQIRKTRPGEGKITQLASKNSGLLMPRPVSFLPRNQRRI